MTQDTPRRGIVRRGVSARPAGAARAVAVAVALLASALGVSSPAAAQAQPFSDTSEDAFYSDAVNALADGGLFEGTECASGMLCPGEPIDRKTMAVWTVRALDGQNPAPIANSRFSDVTAGSFHAPFIERMAELGVTKGCGDGTFCPDDTVTRYQMAVFLKRAFDLEPGPDPGFTDVAPDAWYYNDVAALAASAITAGCGDGIFCPNHRTTRGQMATFLARATGLVGLPQPPTAAPTYTAITAGASHSCALGTDNTITCWGSNGLGQADAPRRPIHRHHHRLRPLLRLGNRQHHHMLGLEQPRGRPTRPTANTPPSPPAASTLAPWEPTTPSHAGATTAWGRPTRPTANTPPSPPAAATLAPWEPTASSRVGRCCLMGCVGRPAAVRGSRRCCRRATVAGLPSSRRPWIGGFESHALEVLDIARGRGFTGPDNSSLTDHPQPSKWWTRPPQTFVDRALARNYVVGVTHNMYAPAMKTVTITMPEELDAQAAAEARRQGISKSELIRRGLAAVLPAGNPEPSNDPWRDMAGFGEAGVSIEPGEIDAVVYGL